jgi:hypothetical protein
MFCGGGGAFVFYVGGVVGESNLPFIGHIVQFSPYKLFFFPKCVCFDLISDFSEIQRTVSGTQSWVSTCLKTNLQIIIISRQISHENRRLVDFFYFKRGFEIDNQPGLTVGTLMDGWMDGWMD